MRYKIFFILIMFLLVPTGCQQETTMTEKPVLTTEFRTEEIKDDIEEIQEIIEDSSDTIKKEAVEIVEENKEEIIESSQSILEETGKIDLANEELTTARNKLGEVKEEVKVLNKTLDAVISERNDAIEEKENAIEEKRAALEDKNEDIHKLLKWLIVICIIGVGAFGVVFLMYGSRFGILGAAGCGLILSISIFVQAYFAYLAVIGGIILLGLIAVLIWNVIVQKRAFREVVDTVEITQEHLPDSERSRLFGGQGQTGIMDTIQSKQTMAMVQKQKKNMSNLWYYAKVNRNNRGCPVNKTICNYTQCNYPEKETQCNYPLSADASSCAYPKSAYIPPTKKRTRKKAVKKTINN